MSWWRCVNLASMHLFGSKDVKRERGREREIYIYTVYDIWSAVSRDIMGYLWRQLCCTLSLDPRFAGSFLWYRDWSYLQERPFPHYRNCQTGGWKSQSTGYAGVQWEYFPNSRARQRPCLQGSRNIRFCIRLWILHFSHVTRSLACE